MPHDGRNLLDPGLHSVKDNSSHQRKIIIMTISGGLTKRLTHTHCSHITFGKFMKTANLIETRPTADLIRISLNIQLHYYTYQAGNLDYWKQSSYHSRLCDLYKVSDSSDSATHGGNYPGRWTTPSPPFTHAEINYAGPFTNSSKGRELHKSIDIHISHQ